MKWKYSYWDNSKYPDPYRRVFTIELDELNIVTADKAFEEHWGYNPMKKPSIGCTLEKVE